MSDQAFKAIDKNGDDKMSAGELHRYVTARFNGLSTIHCKLFLTTASVSVSLCLCHTHTSHTHTHTHTHTHRLLKTLKLPFDRNQTQEFLKQYPLHAMIL
eukprot:COSAG03_NODE_232_length_10264_cov_2.708706_8_plen_100_part_00